MYVHVRDQTDNATYALTRWVPAAREDKDTLPCVRRYSWWVRAISGGNIFFAKYRGCFGGSQMSGGGNQYFARNKEAFPCVRPWTQLSASPRIVHFRWMSFIDHVDQAAPRAPGQWMTARPRKGTTRRQGRLGRCFCFPRGGEYDCMRVYWFVYRRRRITAGVGEQAVPLALV